MKSYTIIDINKNFSIKNKRKLKFSKKQDASHIQNSKPSPLKPKPLPLKSAIFHAL